MSSSAVSTSMQTFTGQLTVTFAKCQGSIANRSVEQSLLTLNILSRSIVESKVATQKSGLKCSSQRTKIKAKE